VKSRSFTSQIVRVFALYTPADRRKFKFVAFAQIILSLLDLFAIAMFGALSALTVMSIQSKPPGNRVSAMLEFVQISDFSFRIQVAILATVAVFLMILRSFISIMINKRIMYFISLRTAAISSQLTKRLMGKSLFEIKSESTQQRVFELTSSISAVGIGVMSPLLQTLGDISLLCVLIIGLLSVDSLMTLLAFAVFSSVAFIGYFYTQKKIGESARKNTELSISSSEKIISLIEMYREYYLRDSLSQSINKFEEERVLLAKHSTNLNFFPSIPKYFLETSIFITVLALGAFQFSRLDASNSISTLAIFLAAASRIAPASLRIQQSVVGIRNNIELALPAIILSESLNESKIQAPDLGFHSSSKEKIAPEKFDLSVRVTNFTFEENSEFRLSDIVFKVPMGKTLAIVGPSGAGKSTLVDLILGFLDPQDSSIKIGNLSVREVIHSQPGFIGYVPQFIPILNGSFEENISLSLLANENQIWNALEQSELLEYVESLPNGLATVIGDRGVKVSGGQRQRIGLARALYTSPKLLILDEATSALDAVTEDNISESLKLLHGEITTIVIAHRLSTVRKADMILYLEGGKCLSIGDFDETRERVPNFDKQAKLMGL